MKYVYLLYTLDPYAPWSANKQLEGVFSSRKKAEQRKKEIESSPVINIGHFQCRIDREYVE